MKHLRLFETEAEYISTKTTLDRPCVAFIEDNNEVVLTSKGLKFTALEDMELSLVQKYVGPGYPEASEIPFVNIIVTDSQYNILTDDLIHNSVSISQNESVYIHSENGEWPAMIYTKYSSPGTFGYAFASTGRFKVSGKITDLTDSELCCHMFNGCTGLTVAPKLPATTLAANCYQQMFYGCTGLTVAPKLPATTLAANCYQQMFQGCTGLTVAPELPATTLAANCYQQMFKGCTGLTVAPELPATTLAANCYQQMFYGCTGLTVAPELPATTLAANCYQQMFYGCTGLTVAPELPATTLAVNCYIFMFKGCSNLNSIKVGATSWNETYATEWLSGVSSTGTFTKPSGTSIPSGANGIPSGWTVVNV